MTDWFDTAKAITRAAFPPKGGAMYESGVHSGIPLTDYIADPAPEPSLNTGTAMALLTQSPLHAKMQHVRLNPTKGRDDSARADIGTIAHALLLENDGSRVVQIEADDWRTKAAKEQREEARAAGKVPVLTKDYAAVLAMVEAAQCFMLGSDLCEDWLSATPEQTLIWNDGGAWCRSRPDKLTPDYKVYFDYKTTGSAHPAAFVKAAINQGYDIQAALGRRGVEALTGAVPTVVFLVQEVEAPYACSLVTFSPMFVSIANERLEVALHKWKQCMASNHWPGYSEKVATVDPPGWYGMEEVAL
jgi:hypothetical protein